ncbi:MAG: type IV pilus assembly protein PilM [Deltaproteobacteria bacterium]|nr:type IV pilus assembly protein PilM [Deltaproteobacteria bacterium]
MFIFDRGGLTGVDIGSYAAKVVRIKGKGTNRSLEAVGYSRLDQITFPHDSSKLSEMLRNLFNANRIKTKNVRAALSGGSLVLTHLHLPNMPKKDLKEAVRWEMRKQVTFPPEELVCDFTTLGEAKRGEESALSLMAFGAQKKDVEQLMRILEAALLEPVAVDVAPMAMLACFDYNNVWENGVNYSMIDIGDSKSTLAIFKDKKLLFAREIPIAGREITIAVMNKLACSEEIAEREKIRCGIVRSGERDAEVVDVISAVVERLAAEAHRSFDYYQAQFREGGIGKIFLCGGTARLKGIDDFFANILGIPCFTDDPLRNIKIESKRFDAARIREFAPDLAVSVGLAL